MSFHSCCLSNGLRIIHVPSTSDVTYCGYVVNAGTRDEYPLEQGMAHFVEHNIFKGTTKRRPWHILNRMEHVGGNLDAFTSKEETVIYSVFLNEHFSRAAELLTDIVFHSTFPQSEIDKEVEVIIDEIQSYEDSPAELIFDDFEDILFKGHPLGRNILGKPELLRQFTTESALQFVQRYYRTNNAIFFVQGNYKFERIVRAIEKLTSNLSMEEEEFPRIPVPAYQPQHVVLHRDTHQAHVMMGTKGYDIHHPMRITLYLLNNILGGPSMNARLNLALRERNGLVYTVQSTMVSYSDTGMWSIYFGCDPHDINKCLRLVRRELDKVMQKPLSANALRTAKQQLKGQIAIACDNREQFALDFGKSYLHYGWEKNVDRLFESIDKVTAEDIQKVANELFATDKLKVLIFK